MTERIADRERQQPVAGAERRAPPPRQAHAAWVFVSHRLRPFCILPRASGEGGIGGHRPPSPENATLSVAVAAQQRGGRGAGSDVSPHQKSFLPHAPSTMLRMVPLPRTVCGGGETKSFSRCVSHPSFANHQAHEEKELPPQEGRRSANRRTSHAPRVADKCTQSAQLICCAAAAHVASRSPFGAPPRHSPGRTHPPLAQLQFRVS